MLRAGLFQGVLDEVFEPFPSAKGVELQAHLEDLEDIYLAEKALEDIRAGRVKTISLDEMSRRLGLDD